jgi:hypothetical protein
VTRTNSNLSSSSLVLATIQGTTGGNAVTNVAITPGYTGSFTINVQSAAPAGGLVVAWFVVN